MIKRELWLKQLDLTEEVPMDTALQEAPQSLQERLRAGTFTFPATPMNSKLQGFTGDVCWDCGNYTVAEAQNLTHKYLACRWCDSRKPVGPI